MLRREGLLFFLRYFHSRWSRQGKRFLNESKLSIFLFEEEYEDYRKIRFSRQKHNLINEEFVHSYIETTFKTFIIFNTLSPTPNSSPFIPFNPFLSSLSSHPLLILSPASKMVYIFLHKSNYINWSDFDPKLRLTVIFYLNEQGSSRVPSSWHLWKR